jgi:hypothetical protein
MVLGAASRCCATGLAYGHLAALSLGSLWLAPVARAEPAPVSGAQPVLEVPLDRVAVRFTAPETGGIGKPQFIFERELAFEARLEALTDAGVRPTVETPYLERHVRAALERHMAEVLLQSLEVTPEPTPRDVELRIRSARLTLQQQLGGAAELDRASQAEGISPSEVSRLLSRRARASLYLDRMVATMLTPHGHAARRHGSGRAHRSVVSTERLPSCSAPGACDPDAP